MDKINYKLYELHELNNPVSGFTLTEVDFENTVAPTELLFVNYKQYYHTYAPTEHFLSFREATLW